MRILHTADWHLNDRLGRIDRTSDLRLALERIADMCEHEAVDILLVAGDLFSELARPDALRETIRHWQELFSPFLTRGGTILSCTGNHDNENFCQTLRHAMNLAAPIPANNRLTSGRLYLAAEPCLWNMPDPSGQFVVQFLMMPYPTPSRYLRGESGQKYSGPGEKNRLLVAAFQNTLGTLRAQLRIDQPSILTAHLTVLGSGIGPLLFRIIASEDVAIPATGWTEGFDYVALGHIHKAQALGSEFVRYSGSIETMDLGERLDAKSAVVIEINAQGATSPPRLLPLPSSQVYELTIADPATDLPRLREKHPSPVPDLVNLHIQYTAGKDNLESVLHELEKIFPRWYARDWREASRLDQPVPLGEMERQQGMAEIVRGYLEKELLLHDPAEREAIIKLAEELIQAEEAKGDKR